MVSRGEEESHDLKESSALRLLPEFRGPEEFTYPWALLPHI